MSDLRTGALADRYGRVSPARRRTIIIASGVLGAVALAWVAWAAWFQSTPSVQSSLRSFEVVDPHTVSAVLVVLPHSREVSARCLVRAYGSDHSVVGELNFGVEGQEGTVVRPVRFRTERAATSVEMVGCTAPGQGRPR